MFGNKDKSNKALIIPYDTHRKNYLTYNNDIKYIIANETI